MARYKHTDAEGGQGQFLTVNLKAQLLPGTFEYMLNDLIENKIVDISIFDENYKNDATGAKAIPPAALIKLIIYGYRKGQLSSRKLCELAQCNIIAKSLTNDMEPHWTTIADFISSNSEQFENVFAKILMYCEELNLVGGEDLAVDGCRLPSNASIEMSGTEEELEKKLAKCRKMAEKHIAKHREADEAGTLDKETQRRDEERQKALNRRIEKISVFLDGMEKKEGKREREVKSNVTDNDSAMIHSSKGTIQGYIGIAIADKKNQIIVSAQAAGSSNEGEFLPPILDKALENLEKMSVELPPGAERTITADANYLSEENLQACLERGVEAVIPDGQSNRQRNTNGEKKYEAADFTYHEEEDYYECPNGKKLRYKHTTTAQGGRKGKTYETGVNECRSCPLNSRCISARDKQGNIKRGRRLFISNSNAPGSLCVQMRKKLGTKEYQNKYAYRIQIIEPVFSSITYCKGLNRFTLRGNKKVNGQWKLFCIVHNLSKCLQAYNKEKEYA